MIIDCHGHYTTVPKPLRDWRQRQIDAIEWLEPGEREKIFHGNVRRVYKRYAERRPASRV
jgi:hypothetical protein